MAARVATLKAIFTAETGQAEAGFRRMESQTSAFGQAAGGVFDGLGVSLGQFAGPAGIGLAVAGMAKGVWSLEQMREESAQLEARFVGFTGGVGQANAAMQAFNATIGNAMSKDEKMAAASQLLGLGIASTAQEAATLSQQALILGLDIDTLAQALETGRATGLVKFGISMTEVTKRAGELQEANTSLSATEAKSLAIREQLAAKARLVADAGGQMVKPTEELKHAFDTLNDSIADFIHLEGGIRSVTGSIVELTNLVNDLQRGGAVDPTLPAQQQIAALEKRIAYLKGGGGLLGAISPVAASAMAAGLQAQLDDLRQYGSNATAVRAAMEDYRQAVVQAQLAQMDFDTAVANGIPEQIAATQATLNDANQYRNQATAAYQAAIAVRDGAGAEADGKVATDDHADAMRAAMTAAKDYGDSMEEAAKQAGYLADEQMRFDEKGHAERAQRSTRESAGGERWEAMGQAYQDAAETQRLIDVRARAADAGRYAGMGQYYQDKDKKEKETATKAAKTWQTEMERARDAWLRDYESDFKSATEGAISASRGLLDLTPGKGNPNAPGANGFAEDVYRLQAFINDGTWGETAAKYGLDKAGATDVVKKFQSGMWDESVLKVLNMDQLKQQIKDQQVGKQMMDALAADLAAETQGDPKLIKAMLGMGGGGDGKGAGGAAGAAASGMDLSAFSSGFLASVDAEITARATDYELRGRNMFKALGVGFVKEATESGIFRQGVTAIVESVLAEGLD